MTYIANLYFSFVIILLFYLTRSTVYCREVITIKRFLKICNDHYFSNLFAHHFFLVLIFIKNPHI